MCCKMTFDGKDAILTTNRHLFKGYNAAKLMRKLADKGFQQTKIFFKFKIASFLLNVMFRTRRNDVGVSIFFRR